MFDLSHLSGFYDITLCLPKEEIFFKIRDINLFNLGIWKKGRIAPNDYFEIHLQYGGKIEKKK